MDIWSRIFDNAGFIPRAECGAWTPALIRLHNVSDFFIWTAYLAIPLVLIYFASKRRGDLPFLQVFWLFGLFIVACGTTHLMDIVLFYDPVYRLAGVIKLITAAASWGTVFALRDIVPRALSMRSPEVLEREITIRERAEAEVRELNSTLEERVRERTAELEDANAAKDDLLQREQIARKQAEEASRIKDEFLATVSHELRTPLNAIMGWSSLLQTSELDAETRAEAIATIERSGRVQMKIIDEILDTSRFVMGKVQLDFRPVNPASVIEASLSAARPATEAKGIEVQVSQTAQSLLVLGDPDRLQQVIWNLLSNAVKFTPRGGRIEVGLAQVGSHAEIKISDTGQGIASQFLPYVFDRFRQADSSSTRIHGGLGLGLAIVRHLVEMHGGSVQVESAGENKGATFFVRLPLMAIVPHENASRVGNSDVNGGSEETLPAGNSAPARTGKLGGVSALVVDDDADARRMVSKSLELHGAQVKTAASALDALAILETWSPDILLSDIGMPHQDGLAFIKELRSRETSSNQHIVAIALSAYAGKEDADRSLAAGFAQHLTKPVVPDALVAAILALLNRDK